MTECKCGTLSTGCFKCAHYAVCKYKDRCSMLKSSVLEIINHEGVSKSEPFELKVICKNFMEAKPLPVPICIDTDFDNHPFINRKPFKISKENNINDIIHNRDILDDSDNLN